MTDSDSDDGIEMLQYKVIVVGDGAVGKTSLIMRFCEDAFKQSYKQTIGLDFFIKRFTLPNNVHITLQIWDIGGQQIGGKMLQNYIFGSHAVIIVYDITNPESFKNAEDWLDVVRKACTEQERVPQFILVGNKTDLCHLRAITAEKQNNFALENTLGSYFVSAKTGDKVNSLFLKIAADLAGVTLTKSELEAPSESVVNATVVNHAVSSTNELSKAEIQRTLQNTNQPTGMECTIQ